MEPDEMKHPLSYHRLICLCAIAGDKHTIETLRQAVEEIKPGLCKPATIYHILIALVEGKYIYRSHDYPARFMLTEKGFQTIQELESILSRSVSRA